MTKKGMTVEEHTKMGIELKEMRDKVDSMIVKLSHHYPFSSGFMKKLHKAQLAIDQLRADLDTKFFQENQKWSPAPDQDTFVYYPGNKDIRAATGKAESGELK